MLNTYIADSDLAARLLTVELRLALAQPVDSLRPVPTLFRVPAHVRLVRDLAIIANEKRHKLVRTNQFNQLTFGW